MRYILAILGLAVLVLAGCDVDEETVTSTHVIYLPGPAEQRAVQILSPAPNILLQVQYLWQEDENADEDDCPFQFVVDTAFMTTVATDLPGGVHLAQLYYKRSNSGAYYSEGDPFYPASDTFTVAFLTRRTSSLAVPSDTTSGAFCIRVTAGDQSNWISAAIPYRTLAVAYPRDEHVPLPPLLQRVEEYTSHGRGDHLSVYWCRQSAWVDYGRIFYRPEFGQEPDSERVEDNERNVLIHDYLPECNYTFWTVAINGYGPSQPSDTVQWFTAPPAMPGDFRANTVTSQAVQLQWYNQRSCDSLLVNRRDASSPWNTIHKLDGDNSWGYIDSTVVAQTEYYYRLGMEFANGIWWSEDSLRVAVP